MSSGRDEMFDGLTQAWRQEQMERIRRGLSPQSISDSPFGQIKPMGQVDQLGRGDATQEAHMRSFAKAFAKAMEQKFEAHRQQTQQVIERISTEVNDLRSMYDYIYRHHPEVIKEYDVIQRTKERLNVKGE
jgi:hypothetical protein